MLRRRVVELPLLSQPCCNFAILLSHPVSYPFTPVFFSSHPLLLFCHILSCSATPLFSSSSPHTPPLLLTPLIFPSHPSSSLHTPPLPLTPLLFPSHPSSFFHTPPLPLTPLLFFSSHTPPLLTLTFPVLAPPSHPATRPDTSLLSLPTPSFHNSAAVLKTMVMTI